jgi:hypothetical protein
MREACWERQIAEPAAEMRVELRVLRTERAAEQVISRMLGGSWRGGRGRMLVRRIS